MLHVHCSTRNWTFQHLCNTSRAQDCKNYKNSVPVVLVLMSNKQPKTISSGLRSSDAAKPFETEKDFTSNNWHWVKWCPKTSLHRCVITTITQGFSNNQPSWRRRRLYFGLTQACARHRSVYSPPPPPPPPLLGSASVFFRAGRRAEMQRSGFTVTADTADSGHAFGAGCTKGNQSEMEKTNNWCQCWEECA